MSGTVKLMADMVEPYHLLCKPYYLAVHICLAYVNQTCLTQMAKRPFIALAKEFEKRPACQSVVAFAEGNRLHLQVVGMTRWDQPDWERSASTALNFMSARAGAQEQTMKVLMDHVEDAKAAAD